ncbi:hypothetical protein ASE88_16455 [Sphingomonas sp. Leaf38]|nr:hypothetical protein ASE88_16455 [Sphingomonas sp. Leaf38]
MERLPMNVIVTVTFNALNDDILEPFLDSIEAQRNRDFILLIVDNASTDGTADYLRQLDRPNTHVILNDENVGFAKGCNQGLAFARSHGATHITFINNDTEFNDSLMHAMVVSLEEQKADALVPLITYYSQPDRIWFVTGSFRLARGIIPFHDHIGRLRREVPMKAIEDTKFASGCCITFNIDSFEAMNGFDERHFVYWEDAELCMKMAAAGQRIVVDTRLECRHKVSVSTGGSFSAFSIYHFTRGHMIFVRDHFGKVITALVICVSLAKAVLNVIRGRMKIRGLKSWYRGIVSGLHG